MLRDDQRRKGVMAHSHQDFAKKWEQQVKTLLQEDNYVLFRNEIALRFDAVFNF